jgi:hypothetical protein
MGAWKVTILGPVAERRRHSVEIAVARERFQEHGCEFSEESDSSRMLRHPGKPARAAARSLDRARPFQWMLADALFPTEM